EAVQRGAVGLERKSRIMHADEKQRVAYHEAGHALVSCALPNSHPVHKVSIIPRGVGALGYVLRRPEEDRYLMTQSELESHIKVALAGTLAEEIVFREISNGATNIVRAILQSRRPALEAIAMRLIETEVMDGSELRGLIDQHDPRPKLVPGTQALTIRDEAPKEGPADSGVVGRISNPS